MARRSEIEAEQQGGVDGGDVFAGVVLLLAIPALTYVLLAMFGLPVSGRTNHSAVDVVRMKDRLSNRPPPPPTEAEMNDKLAYVEGLKERASVYLDRSRNEEENVDVDRWQMHSRNTLNKARSTIELLRNDLKKAPDLASFETTLNRHLSDINQQLVDIQKASRFINN
ncbi:MAG: hypothetical protein AAF581_05485 [Planctomycetota bacterium]